MLLAIIQFCPKLRKKTKRVLKAILSDFFLFSGNKVHNHVRLNSPNSIPETFMLVHQKLYEPLR